ncbi:MAG: Asp-tRNA(Asn)/Glu-tRNA(Gln) amidotransferase subunit GatC [Mucilaginibacter sp.]|uniref:Asp-tRNA(Asn)/Glu-tRNA(Gln) amidotransferase subunit GatC n=1 Tax=Mucilaginibacter sp. TaxID=1882438 RepID=UPI003265B1CA
MTIDNEIVDKIAHLARLDIKDSEKADMAADMNKVLDFMAKLNEVNTTGVEPLVYMTEITNSIREDVVLQEITHEEALENAPEKNADYFRVAKVIG